MNVLDELDDPDREVRFGPLNGSVYIIAGRNGIWSAAGAVPTNRSVAGETGQVWVIGNVSMTPAQTRELAATLIEAADTIEAGA